MSLSSLLNCAVTRTTPIKADENEYGEWIISFSDSLGFNAAIQLNTGEEELQIGGKVIIAEYILYCLPSVNIQEGDKITYKLIDYRVIFVDDECQRMHHSKIFLKRIP